MGTSVFDLTSSPSVNWSRFLDQTRRDYESPPAKGLSHGVQKEAIQNGWGARDGRQPWSFHFTLRKAAGKDCTLLSMTDTGTIGLIGDRHFDVTNLGEDEPIPDSQRLARFEAMFESGDTVYGPGLFGRGKLIFNAASKRKAIWYDSLTKDGVYRFGIREIVGRDYNQFKDVYEASSAIKELAERSAGRLTPLTEPGTRVTIVDPIDELVAAVDDGTFLQAIESTWWEVIQKYNATISVQSLPGQPVIARVPKDFGGLPDTPAKGWRVYHRENVPLPAEGHRYRIKKLHFLVPPMSQPPRSELLGLYVHRRGMVVGRVNMSGLPAEIADRFFGYVFCDAELETALAAQENTTHYGFTAQQRAPYRHLKQLLQTEFDAFLEELGLKKPETSAEEKVRRLVEDAQADLNSILNGLGVPGFGTGRASGADIQLSVENLVLPAGSNQLSIGDSVEGFQFKAEYTGRETKDVTWEVRTFDREAGVLETLLPRAPLSLAPRRRALTPPLTIRLQSPPYSRHSKIGCVCEVNDADGVVIAKKTFYLFVDVNPPLPERLAEIRLLSADWPREDSRRVDYGQGIELLTYEIENHTHLPMQLRVRVRTLWANESNAPIAEVHAEDVALTPYQAITLAVPRVDVTRDVYQEVHRGKVNLRCHAVALAPSELWSRGDRLAENTVSFFLNMDPAYGFWEDTVFHQGGPAAPRSEPRPVDAANRTWKLSINETHPAWERSEGDDQRRRDYLFEEMARQTIYVLLRMSQEDVVTKLAELARGQKIEDLGPAELIEDIAYKVADKVLAAYYGG